MHLHEIFVASLPVLFVAAIVLFDFFYVPAMRPYDQRYRDWRDYIAIRTADQLAADVAVLEPKVLRRFRFRRKLTLTQIVRGVRAYPADVERAVVALTEQGVLVPQWPRRALDEQCPYRLA
jgi:hypothetical protein